MAKEYSVTTGPKAYSFYDQSTGINVIKGEVKKLTPSQYRSKRIQMAINTGHLIMVQDPAEATKQYSDSDINKMYTRMKLQINKGMEISKMAKSYTLEQAKLVAKAHNIEVDDTDTVESILEVLFQDNDEDKK